MKMDTIHCELCGAVLVERTTVWLELNSRTGLYSDREGEIPANESQGWFAFGTDCAGKVNRYPDQE